MKTTSGSATKTGGEHEHNEDCSHADDTNGLYVVAGVSGFFLSEKLVYSNIDQARYTRLFAILLFISGVVLVVKGVL